MVNMESVQLAVAPLDVRAGTKAASQPDRQVAAAPLVTTERELKTRPVDKTGWPDAYPALSKPAFGASAQSSAKSATASQPGSPQV
jgi:hypothetical protein